MAITQHFKIKLNFMIIKNKYKLYMSVNIIISLALVFSWKKNQAITHILSQTSQNLCLPIQVSLVVKELKRYI